MGGETSFLEKRREVRDELVGEEVPKNGMRVQREREGTHNRRHININFCESDSIVWNALAVPRCAAVHGVTAHRQSHRHGRQIDGRCKHIVLRRNIRHQ